ncbi:DNA polymerase III, chi subunit [Serpentinimonas raichei]|uniref:DNA polymerase III, chi subunit n=1 Tax=Serpentinimonas raichei TaxID=1458425 RepID=A0A060NGX6_9BURK|nr:DNA polymerase III subunit chi [Serpentinimonas raichei]BAO80272.1 DNA polymerase III, chi subunit [Serpentinimonas raichei]
MNAIAFHFNVPAPVPYLCRLLRKATHAGQRAWVLLPPALAHELDVALWTFAPEEFIAHARHATVEAEESGQVGSGQCLWQRSPVVLAAQLIPQASDWPLLINLLEPVPEGFERFGRLIEIVPQDEALKQAARLRWRHYSQLGLALKHHDAAA